MNGNDKYSYELQVGRENDTAASLYTFAASIPGDSILDLGCGRAVVSGKLHAEGRDVTAADVAPEMVEAARSQGIAKTHYVDLSTNKWWESLGGPFDIIILADVLEHLTSPERVLSAIRSQELLTHGGSVLVSIPNAGHTSVVGSLLGGYFDYQSEGILDETHVRWFTRASFIAMAERCGFVVARSSRTFRSVCQTPQRDAVLDIPPDLWRAVEAHTGLDGRTYQFVFELRIAGETSRLKELNSVLRNERSMRAEERREFERSRAGLERESRAQSDELEGKIQSLGEELAAARDRVGELEALVDKQRWDLESIGGERDPLQAEVGEGPPATTTAEQGELAVLAQVAAERRREAVEHAKKAAALEKQLRMVYSSETWRVGSLLLWLPKRLRGSK